MFIDDEEIAVDIEAAEEKDGVMGVAVVHGGEPFDRIGVVELGNDMDAMVKGFEELTGFDVPVAVEPGVFAPAGLLGKGLLVSGINELVVTDGGADETGFSFGV